MLTSMKKSVLILIAVCGIVILLSGQNDSDVNWLTFEEALAAQDVEKRKMVVDIFTDWCEWCIKMDRSTFKNKHIAKYLNENFYPVKFNAEHREDIVYKGKTYKFVRNGQRGYHELAVELTRARLSYPTVVFMDEDLEIIQALRGFQSALRFEQIMNYFALDYHKSMPWSKYTENYHNVISRN